MCGSAGYCNRGLARGHSYTRRVVTSVIIPTVDTERWLDVCLPALAAQTVSDAVEIIVVGDGLPDAQIGTLRQRHPSVRAVSTSVRRGFAAACNLGARTAQGDRLAFLNDDTRPDRRWLERLSAVLDTYPDAGMAASLIVGMDGETIDSAGDGYLRCGAAFKGAHGMRTGAGSWSAVVGSDVTESFGACGAAFMIRRALFEELGGFDEDYGMVHEDVDLSYRAQLLGSRCLFVPDAIVEHRGSASLGVLSRQAVYLGQRNLEWTYVKNTPTSLLWRTLPSHLLFVVAGGVGYGLSGHGWTFLEAKAAAVAGLPRMWRKRRAIQRDRRVPVARLEALMERRWIARRYREKRFARARARGDA